MQAEFEKLAREAAAANEGHEAVLVATDGTGSCCGGAATRFRHVSEQRGSPVHKDFDTFDFTTLPHLEDQAESAGTGTRRMDRAARQRLLHRQPGDRQDTSGDRPGSGRLPAGRKRVRFFTAGALVTHMEEAQKRYQLDRFLGQLDKTDLLICGTSWAICPSARAGAELLFFKYLRIAMKGKACC